MESVYRRLAELWYKQKQGELTDHEALDFTFCLNANVNYWWEMAYIENMDIMNKIIRYSDWKDERTIE